MISVYSTVAQDWKHKSLLMMLTELCGEASAACVPFARLQLMLWALKLIQLHWSLKMSTFTNITKEQLLLLLCQVEAEFCNLAGQFYIWSRNHWCRVGYFLSIIQLRHNAIQDRLARAIPPPMGKVTVTSAIPGTGSQLWPDIIVTNEDRKKIIMVEVTVPFENRTPAFHDAWARKVEKCAPLAETLRAKGYQVQTNALIVGALGAWDSSNKRVLKECGIGQCYTWMMWQLMVLDAVRWSRDTYIEHITGHQQYQEGWTRVPMRREVRKVTNTFLLDCIF